MTSIPAVETKILASAVTRGMIISIPVCPRLEVERITDEYGFLFFDNGRGRSVVVDYADLIEPLGYFNPEN